ncbi:hypothetical protein G7046_g9924 [Stylonectria norvegica]|nr:hypothetical protein G7046_g9924 [Stylonectria norvegica]
MSAHLCKQIYASWRQTRQPANADAAVLSSSPPSPSPSPSFLHPFARSVSPPAAARARSVESDRRPSSSSSVSEFPSSRNH